MPLTATLFGFGVFSVMGLSPFKGSFSKFIILYAAIERGLWPVALAGTLATIVAAVYYMLVVQRVCIETKDRDVALAPAPPLAMQLAWPLAALTVVLSLWPAPLLEFAARLAGFPGAQGVPQFDSPWAAPVLVPYVGAFLLYGIGRVSEPARDAAAALLAIATVAVVAFDGSLDPASRLFGLLFSGIAALMIIYSLGYIGRAATANRYYFFAFLMTGSLIGLTTAHELGNFYLFWELMTWTSYFLVVHDGTPKALRAGLVYFLMCAAGAYVMQFGILLTHAADRLVRVLGACGQGRHRSRRPSAQPSPPASSSASPSRWGSSPCRAGCRSPILRRRPRSPARSRASSPKLACSAWSRCFTWRSAPARSRISLSPASTRPRC